MESQLNGFLQLSIVKDSETDPVSYGKADRFAHNLTIKLSWLKYENLRKTIQQWKSYSSNL